MTIGQWDLQGINWDHICYIPPFLGAGVLASTVRPASRRILGGVRASSVRCSFLNTVLLNPERRALYPSSSSAVTLNPKTGQ